MRINQFVAAASGLSRRAADTAIKDGRVTIAGRKALLGETIDAPSDIRLDGTPLTPQSTTIYLMFNKPTGAVSSRVRQGSSPTIYELLPANFQNLRLAGRLDRDSSGLLLLSNDGAFINHYSHPSAGKRKIYELTLSQPFAPDSRRRLEQGVLLEDGISHVTLEAAHGRNLTVSLITGRNRQLRRTFGALGYRVERLHRTHIGPYALGALATGAWQETIAQ